MATIARLSLDEYEQIIASGVFAWPNQRRIELIRGELREMNPIGPDHSEWVARLYEWSTQNMPVGTVRVWIQNPLAFASVDSVPQPDVVWVKRKSYGKARGGHPTAADVLLVIEVAESSLERDRGEKAELYAEVGIRDYWIINIAERSIEVYRDPNGGRYQTIQSLATGETARPLAAPQAALSVDWLFGEPD